MKNQLIERDERTISVENASYRLGYQFISFGLLLIVAFRSFVYKDAGWDLLGLVILGGLVTTGYQGFHKILTRRMLFLAVGITVLSALMAFVIVFFLK